jgi:hypothetical protein
MRTAPSSWGEAPGVAVEWIFEGPLVRISRWRCPPERDRKTAERSHPAPLIVFLHSGNFRVHSSQPIGLLDCTRVAFFNSGVPFRTTHPHGGSDRGSELAVAPDAPRGDSPPVRRRRRRAARIALLHRMGALRASRLPVAARAGAPAPRRASDRQPRDRGAGADAGGLVGAGRGRGVEAIPHTSLANRSSRARGGGLVEGPSFESSRPPPSARCPGKASRIDSLSAVSKLPGRHGHDDPPLSDPGPTAAGDRPSGRGLSRSVRPCVGARFFQPQPLHRRISKILGRNSGGRPPRRPCGPPGGAQASSLLDRGCCKKLTARLRRRV